MTMVGDWGLEINGVPLETYAWRAIGGGYDDLLASPSLRGKHLVMPGAQGRRPYPWIIDETAVSISMLVVGDVDEDGVPLGVDPMEGVFINRDTLRNSLGIGQGGDGTVPAVFYRGDLNPWAGDVTVIGMSDFRTAGGAATFRLDLVIPAGEFEEVAS